MPRPPCTRVSAALPFVVPMKGTSLPVSRSVRLNQALSASMAPPCIHCVGNFARYTWPPHFRSAKVTRSPSKRMPASEPDAVTRAELFATLNVRQSSDPAVQSRSDA